METVITELENKATQYQLDNERRFKNNMKNIYMRLVGQDKYYYAQHCASFITWVEANGFQQYKAEDIESVSIVNCKYYGAKINARLKSGGETHLDTFNDKKEMLGFIVGFNTCAYSLGVN